MKHLIPVIAMAILCHNKQTPPLAPKEGDKSAPAGGSASAPKDAKPEVDPALRIKELEGKLTLADSEISRLGNELNTTRAELSEAREGLAKIGEFVGKNFAGKFDENSSVSEATLSLLQRLLDAPPVASKKELVEGDSAIHVGPSKDGKPGKGVQEVYIIGVNAEKKIACVHGNPAKVIPLDELKLKKRGYEISAEEVAMRDKAFPGATWDVRA
jgi:hypothetical protein